MTLCFVNKSAGVFPVSNNFSFYFHICFLERTDDGPVGTVLYIIYFSGTDDGRRTRCYRLIYVFCARSEPSIAFDNNWINHAECFFECAGQKTQA